MGAAEHFKSLKTAQAHAPGERKARFNAAQNSLTRSFEVSKRLIACVPHGHWRTQTFLAALRSDAITAPCLINGPINGESFLSYVEQFMVQTLKPGDIVVMDNLGSHKAQAIRQALKAVGARLLYLPAYSPDLNPVEQVFSKLKHFLRKAKMRSFDDISDRIADIIKSFPPNECRNYFINAGYSSV